MLLCMYLYMCYGFPESMCNPMCKSMYGENGCNYLSIRTSMSVSTGTAQRQWALSNEHLKQHNCHSFFLCVGLIVNVTGVMKPKISILTLKGDNVS